MALKRKINEATWKLLKPDVQFEYEKDGDEYVLKVEGDEDTAALKRGKDRANQEAKDLKKERDELQAKLDEVTNGDARKAGDIEKLETSWKTKLATQKAEYEGKIAKVNGSLKTLLVDNVATALAAKISTAPHLIKPHILARLTADLDGDEPATRVIGPDGKPSTTLTIDDLSKEFVANKEFSSIIIASKATGGSAPNRGLPNTAGSAPNPPNATVPLAKLTPQEMAARITANKAANPTS